MKEHEYHCEACGGEVDGPAQLNEDGYCDVCVKARNKSFVVDPYPVAKAIPHLGHCKHCSSRDTAVIEIRFGRTVFHLCRGCAKQLAASLLNNLF